MRALAFRARWLWAARTPASSVAFTLTSRLGILLINTATTIIVSRNLGPEGRGTLGAIALLPLLISGLLSLGVPTALRYEIRRRLAPQSEIFASAVAISAILGLVAFVAGIMIAPVFLGKYPHGVVAFARIMLCFAPFMVVNATLQAFYESAGDFKRSSAMLYIPPSLTLGGLIVLLLIHRLTPFSAAVIYELPFASITIVTLVRLREVLRAPKDLAVRARSLLHYGLRAYGTDIINTLAGQIDQALVVGLLSAASFGLYAVAIGGARILAVLSSSLNAVLFPKASGLDRSEAIELVGRAARIVFAFTFVAGVLFALALPVLVPLAFGNQYAGAIGLIRVLTVAMLFAATANTLAQGLLATGRPEVATIVQLAGLCVTVPLMFVLIPRFGLTGAAVAVVISNAVRLVLVMASYPLVLRHAVPSIFLTRRDVRDISGRLRRVTSA